ncbi:MAG: adenylyltransferase/cytidyltransferase family protein [Candidatus Bathyarchaeia archaeon]|jgi:FAD synthetase
MKVLASGVFDLLHYGHIRFLEEAKKLGGRDAVLVVIVASDETVEKSKGRPPVIPEDQRRAVLESLKVVDEAILGYRDMDLDKVMKTIKPDIVAVGHDQHDIEEEVIRLIAEKGYAARVERVGRFGPDDLNSSSKIKRRIAEGSGRRS